MGFLAARLNYKTSVWELFILGGLFWPLIGTIMIIAELLEISDVDITDRLKDFFGGPKT